MKIYRAGAIGALATLVAIGGCNRQSAESANPAANNQTAAADRAADRQREHSDEIAGLNRRVADLERDYTVKNQEVTTGAKTATAGLREEVKEDVANVKKAVGDLQTTTPENWWDRHEQAMQRTVDDIEADVKRLAGSKLSPRPQATTGRTEEGASTAPFTSRRDALVTDLRARVDAMKSALGDVEARGAADTEVEDTRARLNKLEDDLDRLRSASADDWWDISKGRVTEYVDRVEASVKRLDDNKR